MVQSVNNQRVYVRSKKGMIAVTQELEAGVECNIQNLSILLRSYDDYHIEDLSRLFRLLVNRPTLHTLHIISQKGITFENVTGISNILDPNINPLGRLRKLSLPFSKVTDEHVVEICKGLENNKFLKEIIFNDNKIGDSGAKSLGNVLATSDSLARLDLHGNEINNAGAKAIAKGIMQRQYPSHSNIASYFSTQPCKEFELDLRCNNTINDFAATAFASLLHKQHSTLSPLVTLTYLDLSYSSVGDEGAIAIAESVKSYNTYVGLKKLHLSSNLIGNTGAIAFANALKENKVMTELVLSNNKIQLDGGIALCQTLETYNNTLQWLQLDRNPCSGLLWKNDMSIDSYLITSKRNHDKQFAMEYKQRVKAINIFKFISSKGPYEMGSMM